MSFAYYRLYSTMEDYEQKRMEFIISKERELAVAEGEIKAVIDCNEKNARYENFFKQIYSMSKTFDGGVGAEIGVEAEAETVPITQSLESTTPNVGIVIQEVGA